MTLLALVAGAGGSAVAAAGVGAGPAGASGSGLADEPVGYALCPCSGTDSKPQSKIWYNDGSYWCIVDSPAGNCIFELAADRWIPSRNAAAILGGHTGRADLRWDGRRLLVLMYDRIPSLYEFTYVRGQRTYRLARGFPVPLPIAPGSETMVMDEDSTGRLWATYVAQGKVYVAHSRGNQRDWDLPGIVLQDSIPPDDISTVIAFGSGKVGVFWSDQNRDEFGFRVHAGADPPEVWGPPEVVYAGAGHADDHVHLAADGSGRVYAVTKDDANHVNAHRRDPEGRWTTQEDVLGGRDATRPILMTAEADSALVLLYTRWHEGIDTIDYRVSPLGELQFGAPACFVAVPGIDLNDVTGTKQPLPRGSIVAIADGAGMAWWNGWGGPPRPERSRRAQDPDWPLLAHVVPRCPDAALALALDEGAGSEIADASAHAAHASLGGPWAADLAEPSWVPGVSGSALRFNGLYSFVEVPPAAPLDLAGSMTLEAWIRRAGRQLKETILCKGRPDARNYHMRILADGQIDFEWEAPGGKNHGVEGQQVLADTSWHHVACVYDQAGRESRIYIDGKLDRAAPDSGAAAPNDAPLCIGMRLGNKGPKDWFQGDIDLVQLWPVARYTSDFTPARNLGPAGRPALFLVWTPRYQGAGAPATFDVLRTAGVSAPLLLEPAALSRTSFFDAEPPAGRLRYDVRPHSGGRPGPRPLVLEWPRPAPVIVTR